MTDNFQNYRDSFLQVKVFLEAIIASPDRSEEDKVEARRQLVNVNKNLKDWERGGVFYEPPEAG